MQESGKGEGSVTELEQDVLDTFVSLSEPFRQIAEALADCFSAIGEWLDMLEWVSLDLVDGNDPSVQTQYRKVTKWISDWIDRQERESKRPHWQALRLTPVPASTRPLSYREAHRWRWSPHYGRR